MDDRLAEPALGFTELRLVDGEVLPNAVAVGAVAVGETLQCIEHSARPLMLRREL